MTCDDPGSRARKQLHGRVGDQDNGTPGIGTGRCRQKRRGLGQAEGPAWECACGGYEGSEPWFGGLDGVSPTALGESTLYIFSPWSSSPLDEIKSG